MKILEALSAAMGDICRLGIGKARKANAGGANYNFRGIEDAMNEMSPILVRHGIIVLPQFTEQTITERAKGDPSEGKAMRFAVVKGTFEFYATDGSMVKASCYGEAMDSGDKAMTKAQSVALRTCLFDSFMVPTMAMDPESDEYSSEPAADESLDDVRAKAMEGTAALRKWWESQEEATRVRLAKYLPELKQAAAAADKEAA